MGSTVSLPEPYSCFPLLSVGDVDRVIHKHRDECEGDFMISTAALSNLLGGSREAESRAAQVAQHISSRMRSSTLFPQHSNKILGLAVVLCSQQTKLQ